MMDEVRMWSEARTQLSLSLNKVTIKPAPFPATLQLYYDFDSDLRVMTPLDQNNLTTTTVVDLSSFARNGLLVSQQTSAVHANVTATAVVCGDSTRNVPYEQVRWCRVRGCGGCARVRVFVSARL